MIELILLQEVLNRYGLGLLFYCSFIDTIFDKYYYNRNNYVYHAIMYLSKAKENSYE